MSFSLFCKVLLILIVCAGFRSIGRFFCANMNGFNPHPLISLFLTIGFEPPLKLFAFGCSGISQSKSVEVFDFFMLHCVFESLIFNLTEACFCYKEEVDECGQRKSELFLLLLYSFASLVLWCYCSLRYVGGRSIVAWRGSCCIF